MNAATRLLCNCEILEAVEKQIGEKTSKMVNEMAVIPKNIGELHQLLRHVRMCGFRDGVNETAKHVKEWSFPKLEALQAELDKLNKQEQAACPV